MRVAHRLRYLKHLLLAQGLAVLLRGRNRRLVHLFDSVLVKAFALIACRVEATILVRPTPRKPITILRH